MTPIDRARAEHAAKYDREVMIPAREYLALLDEIEQGRPPIDTDEPAN